MLLMCSSSSTRQKEQKPIARPWSSRARKKNDTPRFSSSDRYIARVQGFENDACSMARMSSISDGEVSGSIVNCADISRTVPDGPSLSVNLSIGPAHVQRLDGGGGDGVALLRLRDGDPGDHWRQQ